MSIILIVSISTVMCAFLIFCNIKLHKKDKMEKRAFLKLIKEIVMEFDSKDPYFNGHTRKVLELATEMANRLNLDVKMKFYLELAIYIGQVSKIRIPERILYKREKLSDDEFNIIKRSPIIAYKMVDKIKEVEEIKNVVKYQHEKYNGEGYPKGISGEEIPLLSRIINIADSYDAMISERPYKSALTKTEALKELEEQKNRQFDPKLVDLVLEILQEEKLDLN